MRHFRNEKGTATTMHPAIVYRRKVNWAQFPFWFPKCRMEFLHIGLLQNETLFKTVDVMIQI